MISKRKKKIETEIESFSSHDITLSLESYPHDVIELFPLSFPFAKSYSIPQVLVKFSIGLNFKLAVIH